MPARSALDNPRGRPRRIPGLHARQGIPMTDKTVLGFIVLTIRNLAIVAAIGTLLTYFGGAVWGPN